MSPMGGTFTDGRIAVAVHFIDLPRPPCRDIIALVFFSERRYSAASREADMSRLTENSPSVSDAINTRFSCRAFLDKPVAETDVKYIVETAVRAPSGGNLQPWNVHVLQGDARDKLVNLIAEKGQEKPMGEGSEYHIYPPELSEPYNGRRFDIGERMYEIMGVAREDKAARLAWLASNFTFFNAPVGMFFSLDKQMQEGQWSDMGMLIQTMMLLARERGLHLPARGMGDLGADGERIFGHSRQPYFLLWLGARLCRP